MATYSAAASRFIAGEHFPDSFTRYERGAPPPALDVADVLVEDVRPILAHAGTGSRTAEDRLAGFLRLDGDGVPYGLTRVEVTRTLADLLVRISGDFRQIFEETRNPAALAISRALRAVRDTLARQTRASHPLLSNLAEDLTLPDAEDLQEEAARGFLAALPRERLKRSEVTRRYAEAGSPGGYGRNDLLDLAREVFPGAERRLTSGWVFDLSRFDHLEEVAS